MDQTQPSPSQDPAVHVYRFAGFAFDPTCGAVLRPDGTEVELRPKSVEVLRALVESGGRMVPRNALMQAAWPGVFVTDDNITQCIAEIRRALGNDARRLLRTMPKRGYLLVRDNASAELTGAARAVSAAAREDRTVFQRVEPPNRPSIAVLPFINLSGDPGQEYFSDGVADDIIAQLARGGSLFVIARSSSFSYKGRCVGVRKIAHELAVRYVLEGSVRRDGGRIRINAQLIEAETEIHIWAKRYDRDLTAVFAVQDEITRAVATELAPAIAKAERERAIRKAPATLSAWEAYQRGIWHLSREANNDDLNLGLEFFHQAVALDPLFADAHAMLARYYVAEATGRGGPQVDGLLRAESEARSALRLDPDNAAAHTALAWIFSNRHGVTPALEHAEQAINLDANDPSGYLVKGHILVFAHRAAEARLALDTALRLDPRGRVALGVAHHLAVSLYLERDYVSAVAAARRVIQDYPDFPRTYPYLVASLSHLGRDDEARLVLREALSAASAYFDLRVRHRPPYFRLEDHAHMLEYLRKAGWQG
jgi:adenylate cyclase